MSLIELKDIHKTYYIGGKLPVYALRGLSLKVEPGEFIAIMGPSGSGKSTLLAILGLLDKSESGEYLLLNKNISSMGEKQFAFLRNRFFGFVFQSFNLLPKLNVVDNVMLPFIYSSEHKSSKREYVLSNLKKIGLSDRLKHRPNELSGGQQQRAALGRALSNEPLVILADEPTGNLDTKSSQEIMGLLKELNEQGHTIIMVTHEHDIAGWASRVLTLRDGQIVGDERKTVKTAYSESGKKENVNLSEKISIDKIPKSRLLSFAGIKNYCYEAYLSIINNKLRSLLSILGVMIGVAAVITMLALGTGARRNVEETLSSLGTNILMVRAPRRAQGISLGTSGTTRFTFEDLSTLKQILEVSDVVPYVSSRGQVVYKNKNWNTSVVGTSIDYQNLHTSGMQYGRFFTQGEANARDKVAILGKAVADELFGNQNPVGQFVRINRISFQIVGVAAEQGARGWTNLDDQIIIPVKTAMYRLMGDDYIDYFEVKVKKLDSMAYVSQQITSELMRLHRMQESDRESIDIINMAEIQQAASAMVATLSYLLGSVAVVSLLVGGIGIMNIMLVMVMERTHEIGLRKALGAQRSDILVQFLVEAVLICLFGGIIGIGFGILISYVLSTLAQWVIFISTGSIMLAFTFSVLVGVIFGIWPAWRASKLLPIEALRYE